MKLEIVIVILALNNRINKDFLKLVKEIEI